MKNERTAALLQRIEGIIRELEQIRQSLQDEPDAVVKYTRPQRKPSWTSSTVNDEELKQAYLDLRQRFTREGRRAVEQFADQTSVSYLDRFISTNNLPVPTKRGKSETVEALANYLARSVVVRGK
jgi:hypothetical protein